MPVVVGGGSIPFPLLGSCWLLRVVVMVGSTCGKGTSMVVLFLAFPWVRFLVLYPFPSIGIPSIDLDVRVGVGGGGGGLVCIVVHGSPTIHPFRPSHSIPFPLGLSWGRGGGPDGGREEKERIVSFLDPSTFLRSWVDPCLSTILPMEKGGESDRTRIDPHPSPSFERKERKGSWGWRG
eukprot:scaffold56_cov390-Pavlova_lutheri.AAC.13